MRKTIYREIPIVVDHGRIAAELAENKDEEESLAPDDESVAAREGGDVADPCVELAADGLFALVATVDADGDSAADLALLQRSPQALHSVLGPVGL